MATGIANNFYRNLREINDLWHEMYFFKRRLTVWWFRKFRYEHMKLRFWCKQNIGFCRVL
jgi:hypothetical protein